MFMYISIVYRSSYCIIFREAFALYEYFICISNKICERKNIGTEIFLSKSYHRHQHTKTLFVMIKVQHC